MFYCYSCQAHIRIENILDDESTILRPWSSGFSICKRCQSYQYFCRLCFTTFSANRSLQKIQTRFEEHYQNYHSDHNIDTADESDIDCSPASEMQFSSITEHTKADNSVDMADVGNIIDMDYIPDDGTTLISDSKYSPVENECRIVPYVWSKGMISLETKEYADNLFMNRVRGMTRSNQIKLTTYLNVVKRNRDTIVTPISLNYRDTYFSKRTTF